MNRRQLISGALALALMPRKAYSFVGGWGMPAAFIEYDSGEIIELGNRNPFPYNEWQGEHFVHEVGVGYETLPQPNYVAPGVEHIVRIVTPEATAWYCGGDVVETTWRPGRLDPIVIIRDPRTIHEQYSDPRRA